MQSQRIHVESLVSLVATAVQWHSPARGALIVPFFLLVLGMASLKVCISHHAEHATVEDLTGQLLLKASHQIEQSLVNYLGTVRQLVQTNVAALRLGILDPRNPALLEAYFFPAVIIQRKPPALPGRQ